MYVVLGLALLAVGMGTRRWDAGCGGMLLAFLLGHHIARDGLNWLAMRRKVDAH